MIILEADAGSTPEAPAEEPLLSTFDILTLGLLLVVAVYWFFLRKKNDQVQTIKKLTVV